MAVDDENSEVIGEGEGRGECQDCTVWNDSTLEENVESVSVLLGLPRGDFSLGLDARLVTSERTGGAVIDLLQFCIAGGRDRVSGSFNSGSVDGGKEALGVIFVSSVASLKLSPSSSSLVQPSCITSEVSGSESSAGGEQSSLSSLTHLEDVSDSNSCF